MDKDRQIKGMKIIIVVLLVIIFIRPFFSNNDLASVTDGAPTEGVEEVATETNDTFSVGTTKEVLRGAYIVGIDMPDGIYDISYNEHRCSLAVFENKDKGYADKREYFDNENQYYKNLILHNGNMIEISGENSLLFTRNK